MVTVTTVGYGDIVPVGDRARLIDALFVTPVRLFVWFLFVGTAYELLMQRMLEDWRMKRLQRKLAGHVVLCGFGSSGETAARQLLGRGAVATGIVVIDSDPLRAREAADCGYIALHGDATHEDMLRVAGAERADAIVISVARDDTTALVILTVRGLGSRARVVATVRAVENARLLRTSGADELISPWELGGCMLANAVTDDTSARVVQDMVSAGGRIQLAEREARPTELGRMPGELADCLVVQVRRDGESLMFWEAAQRPLERGDILVTVEKPSGVTAPRPGAAGPARPG
jgi:voltage-gated potassium channel